MSTTSKSQTKSSNKDTQRRYRANMSADKKEAARIKARDRMRKRRAAKKKAVANYDDTSPKTTRTKDVRVLTINRIRKQMGAPDGLAFLRDQDTVIAHIEKRYSNLNSRMSTLSHIVGHLKAIEGGAAFDLRLYRKIMIEHIEERDRDYAKNKLSKQDKDKFVAWRAILDMRSTIQSDEQMVIYDLYTLLPPRHGEYRELRLWSKKGSEPDTNANYLDMRNKRAPRMLLNIYKGSSKKGQYVINLVPKSLLRFVRTNYIQHGMYIFRRGLRSAAGWTKNLGDMFQGHTGKRVGINILRKAYASFCFEEDPHMSEQKKGEIAHAMGTSIGKLQLIYRKI